MPDLLVRDIAPEVYEKIRDTAKKRGTSLARVVRETLTEQFTPDRQKLLDRIDEIRKQIGPVEGDSTDIIRAWRDNDKAHR